MYTHVKQGIKHGKQLITAVSSSSHTIYIQSSLYGFFFSYILLSVWVNNATTQAHDYQSYPSLHAFRYTTAFTVASSVAPIIILSSYTKTLIFCTSLLQCVCKTSRSSYYSTLEQSILSSAQGRCLHITHCNTVYIGRCCCIIIIMIIVIRRIVHNAIRSLCGFCENFFSKKYRYKNVYAS